MNTPHTPLPLLPSGAHPARGYSRTDARGFALTELLLAVAVLALVVGLAVPSMKSFMNSSRLTVASNTLLSSMHLARSEAIKRSGRVVLCKTADGISCTSAGGWEQGWIVFHDANNDGMRGFSETVIERVQSLPGSLRVTGNANVARYVSFIATGATKLVGGGFQAGTVTLCNQSASGPARQIVLNAVGRPRVHRVEAVQCA